VRALARPSGLSKPSPLSADIDSEVDHRDAAGVDFRGHVAGACDDPWRSTFEATFSRAVPVRRSGEARIQLEIEAFRKGHAVLAVWPYLRSLYKP